MLYSLGKRGGHYKIKFVDSVWLPSQKHNLTNLHHLVWGMVGRPLGQPGSLQMLESFRWIRCSFTYFPNPATHFLHSLRASIAHGVVPGVFLCFFLRGHFPAPLYSRKVCISKVWVLWPARSKSPSALDLLGAISQAVAVERRQAQLQTRCFQSPQGFDQQMCHRI